MSDTRTRPTGASVREYIAARASEEQKADCRTLMSLFRKLTGQRPRMWGPSIVGYGSYCYTYQSGRSGTMPLAAFAIRGRHLVVYLDCDGEQQHALLLKLGKHRMGRSCLYIRRLGDVSLPVLEQIVAGSIEQVRHRYG